MAHVPDSTAEWLEADGLGGFASGTANGVRTRRYHALLLAATTPPTGRMALVNAIEAWLECGGGAEPLTTHRYAPDVLYPDGRRRLEAFEADPWPRWTYRLDDGRAVEHEVLVGAGRPLVALSWRLAPRGRAARSRGGPARLRVRPLLSGRDSHALHHENPAFRFDAETRDGLVVWRPYDDVPAIAALANGSYQQRTAWYRGFLYEEERVRGLDCVEDLASPGEFSWDLTHVEAVLVLAAECGSAFTPLGEDARATLESLRASERRRRRRFPSRLERAAADYVVRRGRGKTIVAGYPWFTDWGRDTFIALRGLCLATGRLEEARAILLEWAGTVSRGMLPNRFVERGEAPEFNSVDASLWYVVAVHETLEALAARGRLSVAVRRRLEAASDAILEGYASGTRYGIHATDDGLLAAGEPGVQLTWMDAKVGDWVVTPRIGKPVEGQALWLNALRIGAQRSERWGAIYERGLESFRARFWDDARGYLADVVDVAHRQGAVDHSFRPNQIFAVGGLPFAILGGGRARRLVDLVESRLWTPLGLRSLAPGEPGYAPRYQGGVRERDGAYHQGTVWPWLAGPFVEAWVRVRSDTDEAKREARARFLHPLLRHVGEAGLGHISEIADAEPPHTPRGCPFQAWSVGEALRLKHRVLAAPETERPRAPQRARNELAIS
ncbi:MAG: glycogen debranching protein [Candidatus Eisenbacteria bacterium]|uniref:Glycogen debranching protein n=1 Tax=Eiseniibacteriota bacterium TaxID=2212470 RepID=A0A538TVQ0_UNCEI|nr:MAG: glycogen debranching protein [Candidatus Eisenbacteria bacterium]